MTKKRIVLVDDSHAVCREICRGLSVAPEFEIVKVINDPLTAVSEILKLKPDILLLDVVMSALDGEDILESLGSKLDFVLGIIILNPLCDDMTISRFSRLGAHYFIAKPINCETLIKKMKRLCENLELESNSQHETQKPECKECEPDYDGQSMPLTPKIAKFLIKAGVSPKHKGFCFLKESIRFICLSGNELSSVTKIVYPKIAKDYGTDAEKVERAIRTAIEKAFTVDGAESFYYETLGSCRAKKLSRLYPSNREFIFTIAEHVKNIDTDLIG